MKNALLERKDQFARCLAEKLLTYAVGRQLMVRDRPHVDRILQSLKQQGCGLSDLVYLTTQSEPFLSK